MRSTFATAQPLEYLSCAKPWKPHNYQKKAVKFLLEHGAAGLFMDPGMGKTSSVLAAIKMLKKEQILKRALVIAPLRVCHEVWPVEVQDWLDFNELKVTVLHGKEKDLRLKEDADIYVINPDGLPWLLANKRFEQIHPDTLVVDESSKFKHTNTKRFKLLKPYLGKFARRWILTGSPMPNGYMDLFGQMYLLDLGRSLGAYITHFRFNYFTPSGYGGYTWTLKPESAEAIQAQIAPLTLRMDAEDYLELPEIVPDVIRVTLPDNARKVYDELEDDMLSILEGEKVVTALSAAAASVKCRQVANGGVYYQEIPEEGQLPNKRETVQLHDAKTEALTDLIDELQGAQLAIAYEFNHDLERILKVLPKDSYAVIGGGTTEKYLKWAVQAWNESKIQFLVAHRAAMAHGLNLQKSQCRHICEYALTWNQEEWDQFIKRFRRQGNKAAQVFLHSIVCRNTVDEAMLRAIKKKTKDQNTMLLALKDYIKARRR